MQMRNWGSERPEAPRLVRARLKMISPQPLAPASGLSPGLCEERNFWFPIPRGSGRGTGTWVPVFMALEFQADLMASPASGAQWGKNRAKKTLALVGWLGSIYHDHFSYHVWLKVLQTCSQQMQWAWPIQVCLLGQEERTELSCCVNCPLLPPESVYVCQNLIPD